MGGRGEDSGVQSPLLPPFNLFFFFETIECIQTTKIKKERKKERKRKKAN